MSDEDPSSWNRRYREGEKHAREDPSKILVKWEPNLPTGRALDVACGTGRNSIFLAEKGYKVDALDFSREALEIGRKRAREKGLEVNWIEANLNEYKLDPEIYDLVMISFFYLQENFAKVKNSLRTGGYIIYEHHITTNGPAQHGPKNPDFRFDSNELIERFMEFQILSYREGWGTDEAGRKSALARMVARKTENFEEETPSLPD